MQTTVAGHDLEQRLAQQGVGLVCPSCKGPLNRHDERHSIAFECATCERRYPVVHGIPDFRLEPDRFIGIEDDRKKGIRVLSLAPRGDFAEALDAYWSITPELPTRLAKPHKQRQLAEPEIGEALLDELERVGDTGGVMLDLGCGAGGFLIPALFQFKFSVGVDVGFRWLLLAQRRLNEHGIDAPLICANAEFLPFADESFHYIHNNDLLEHVADPARVLGESNRVLRPNGTTYIATNNRFSVAPEPHVRLLGIGWLPRAWQRPYARFRRGHEYDKVRLLSGRKLRRLAKRAFDNRGSVEMAPVPTAHLGPREQSLGRLYQRLRANKPARLLLKAFAPRLQVVARKSPNLVADANKWKRQARPVGSSPGGRSANPQANPR